MFINIYKDTWVFKIKQNPVCTYYIYIYTDTQCVFIHIHVYLYLQRHFNNIYTDTCLLIFTKTHVY